MVMVKMWERRKGEGGKYVPAGEKKDKTMTKCVEWYQSLTSLTTE